MDTPNSGHLAYAATWRCPGWSAVNTILYSQMQTPRFFIKRSVSLVPGLYKIYSVESVSGTASCMCCTWMCNEVYHYHHTCIQYQPTHAYQKITTCFCLQHCYSCCTLATIQMATNLWYFRYKLVVFDTCIVLVNVDLVSDMIWLW